MDVSCMGNNCGSGAALPDIDFDGQKAFAEVQAAVLVKTEGGLEFYCQNHRRQGLIRERKLNPPKPPKTPEISVAMPGTLRGTPQEPAISAQNIGGTAELIVVCQKSKILGVFSTKEKARGIRQMVESISPEPVYCQHWQIDVPGAQIMSEPEPSCDEVEVERGKEEGNGKAKKRGRPKKVRVNEPKDA